MSIAVIGTGHWGKNHVRNFKDLGVLSCICDSDASRSKLLAKEYGVESFGWDEILSSNTIQGVVIALPAELHYSFAKEALLRGKHVFVEKPLALKVEEAEELCILAEERKLTLMVGHLLQYHSAFLKLKDMVVSGQLGDIHYIYSNRLNLGKIRQEEDTLWSFAPHDISMILSLVGEEPEAIDAFGGYYLNKSIADVTATHLSFPSGPKAHVFVSWLHPFKEQKLVIVGSKGMAVFDDGKDWDRKVLLYPHVIEWEEGMPIPSKAEALPVKLEASEPLRDECQHFLDCMQTGHPPKTDGREGLAVLKVLNRATTSLLKDKS